MRMRLAGLEPVERQRHLDADVVGDLRQDLGFLHHLRAYSVATTSAETGPETMRADLLGHLGDVAARLEDQRRVGGDAVEQAEVVELADFLDVGCIDEEFHGRLLQAHRAVHGAIFGRIDPGPAAFALAETRGKVTRHEQTIRARAGARRRRRSWCRCRPSGHTPMRCPTACRSCRARSCACRSARARWRASSGTATAESVDPKKLRPITQVFDCPPIDRATCAVSSTGSPPTRCRRPAWWRACSCGRRRPSIRSRGPKGCGAPDTRPTG